MTSSPTHPNHVISALIVVDPAQARERILAHLREARMHRGHAAEKIGCTHGTLLSWIAKLDMADAVDRLEERARREGWHHGRVGGRPKGSTVENGAAPRTTAARGGRARLTG